MWQLIGIFLSLLISINNLYANLSVDWIDIPIADYTEILGSSRNEIITLNQLVDDYHRNSKCSEENLGKRIDQLNVISSFIDQLSKLKQLEEQKPTILSLNKMVINKRNYLINLSQMPTDYEISSYHGDISQMNDPSYQPLTLRNNLTYSIKMKEFWGKFWLESIDPCHRRLANYYKFWLGSHPQKTDYLSFFLWLESHPIPKYVPIVRYFSNNEIEQCRITLVNGFLVQASTSEFLTTSPLNHNLFVIDLNKQLYVKTWGESIRHTSLTRGKPVLGAGFLHSENGVIQRFACESGHYLPSLEQSFQSLQILLKQGARFHNPLEIIYFENRNKYKVLIPLTVLHNYEEFYQAIHESSKRELLSSSEF